MSARPVLVAFAAACMLAASARSEVTPYTDENQFLNALVAQGFVAVQESFEDDAVWGEVRTTVVDGQHTAPSITNLGITWRSNSPNNDVTTAPGPARTGAWGFFSLPHGDYANGITDGWTGTATDSAIVALGGWVRTNTPPAGLDLIVDGIAVDFAGDEGISTTYTFFGAIDPDGFSTFEFRELEGKLLDQKFIFSDDFTFAFSGELLDCNDNAVADGQDVLSGNSPDCNANFIPDECEIDAASTAPGGPFYCTTNCAPDCNVNGVPDACDVVTNQQFASGQLTPIGVGSPQTYLIPSPPTARGSVTFDLTAYANLGGGPDTLEVALNGMPLGQLFGTDGSDCPDIPDEAHLIVPAADFNDAVAGGDAEITITASAEVAPDECDLPTYVTVTVNLPVSSDEDLDGDGVPDTCAAGNVPAVSTWGVVILALVIMICATRTFACRPRLRTEFA